MTMIKKTLAMAILAILLIVPAALANDAGDLPDNGERLSYTCKAISTEARIGEAFQYALTITNNTDKEIEIIDWKYVFKDTSRYDYDFINIIIQPYETKQFDLSTVVPENLKFYKGDDGTYYTDFCPTLTYFAQLTAPGEEPEQYYKDNPAEDTWSFYQICDDVVPIPVTNVADGSAYMSLELQDSRSKLLYFNYVGEYRAVMSSHLKIENIGGVEITDISMSSGYFAHELKTALSPSEVYEFNYNNDYYYDLDDVIDPVMPIDYCMLFKIDNSSQYYSVNQIKEYATEIIDIPDPDIYVKKEYSDAKQMYVYTCEISNYTDTAYTDMVALLPYDDINYMPKDVQDFEERAYKIDVPANGKVSLPFEVEENKEIVFALGRIVNDVYYYKDFYCDTAYDLYNQVEDNVWNILLNEYVGYFDIYTYTGEDDIVTTEPVAVEPVATEQPEAVTIDSEDSYYIPKWVWPTLAAAAVLCVLLLIIIVANRKK